MARPKKPIGVKSKHHTDEERERLTTAEEKCDPKAREMLDTIPADLINEDAINIWNIWTEYLVGIGFYGNVTVSDLIEYCNADARIIETWRKLKDDPAAASDPKIEGAYANNIKKWSEEKTRCANRGGFSVTARINYAEMKFSNEETAIEEQFGI